MFLFTIVAFSFSIFTNQLSFYSIKVARLVLSAYKKQVPNATCKTKRNTSCLIILSSTYCI